MMKISHDLSGAQLLCEGVVHQVTQENDLRRVVDSTVSSSSSAGEVVDDLGSPDGLAHLTSK